MVAITVILAAVIAAFVLGLGDTSSTTPSVTFDFEYNQTGDNVTATVTGGDTFDPARVSVAGTALIDNSSGSDILDDNSNLGAGEVLTSASGISEGTDVTAGDSFKVELQDDSRDFELRIVFESADGGTSAELGSTSGPDA
jgi:FlaG/FlaF family flagellin (archaellin)